MVVAKDVPVIDTFQFAGAFLVPATAVPLTDPVAVLGTLAPARSTGRFSGSELGFSFVSKPGANTERGYAEIGTERNGVFLS